MRTHRLPPPDLDCVMQDVKLQLLNLQWFRVLGASFSRFKGLRFRVLSASFSSFGCFVFDLGVLCFRVLGAPFSRFRGLRFRSRVLRFRDLGASCFGLRFRVLRFRNYRERMASSALDAIRFNLFKFLAVSPTRRRLLAF